MIKKTFYLAVILSLLLMSCNNDQKAIEDYCQCMESVISDSLLDLSQVQDRHTKCYDSIMTKYEKQSDVEFINSFDSLPNIIAVNSQIDNKLKSNIDKILKNFMWEYSDKSSWYMTEWSIRRYYFEDNSIFRQELYDWPKGYASWRHANTFTGTYKINVAKDGKIYADINMGADNPSDIYRLRLSKKDGYYLDGRRTLWQENK